MKHESQITTGLFSVRFVRQISKISQIWEDHGKKETEFSNANTFHQKYCKF